MTRPPTNSKSSPTRREVLRRAAALALTGLFTPLTGCRTGTGGAGLDAVPDAPGMPTGTTPGITAEATTLPNEGGLLDLQHLPDALPLPDLSDRQILRRVAGIRPYRQDSYRLECERINGRWVAHNYGHGGSGYTLSWGAAELCADQLEAAAGPGRGRAVAVLGGGVVGLSTARVLRERGWDVTVYAQHFATETTSNWAGAQFAPSGVAFSSRAEMQDMLRRSAVRFEKLADRFVGVSRKINFTTPRGGGALHQLPGDLLPYRTLDRLPFPGVTQAGRAHSTFLIEPPIYLPWLLGDVNQAGVKTVNRTFGHRDELARLPDSAVVNCLGLGAGALFNDTAMQPIRGQLVHLRPQNLPYMMSHGGYLFPRSDVLVLGGSYERGETEPIADAATCHRILQRHRRFFGVGA
ncbi:MAG: FAD-dependent oxidoreductase [Planctomycetota bacterium]